MDIASVIGNYKEFTKSLIDKAKAAGIEITDYSIDHICYRVATIGEYQNMKVALKSLSVELATTIHNGREFSIFKLKQPLTVQGVNIPLVELPSPAKSQSYTTGLEHIEVVIDAGFHEFCTKNREKLVLDENMNTVNSTARITFEDGATVKFHAISLDKAVHLQGGTFEILSQQTQGA